MAMRDMPRDKIGRKKVKRYWPGKAPEWAQDIHENNDIGMERAVTPENRAFPSQEDSDVANKDDPRLRRLAQSRIENRDEIRADQRRFRQAEIVSIEEEENTRQEGLDREEEEEEAFQERRERIKEKSRRRQREEATLLLEEDEEEQSEYETDREEEQKRIAMLKPLFVPKSDRYTIDGEERVKTEELELEELEKRKSEERRLESKQMVVDEVRKDKKFQKNLEIEANIADVNAGDEVNEAEYEAWKAREIERIKRKAMLEKKKEIEQERNMTEEERNPMPAPPRKLKRKWRFMQKYYHKGAFFQSEADDLFATAGSDPINQRDFSAPTGEDKMNKTILPKVMQVKGFGRRGRTKWTHLVNEDTTNRSNP